MNNIIKSNKKFLMKKEKKQNNKVNYIKFFKIKKLMWKMTKK